MLPDKKLSFFVCSADTVVAVNAKAGSSTLSRDIVRTHHPALEQRLIEQLAAANVSPADVSWHNFCPQTTRYADRHVIVPVREPVDRFCAALVQVKREHQIDAVLNELEETVSDVVAHYMPIPFQHAKLNPHFFKQSRFRTLPEAKSVQHFVVPDQFSLLAAAAELPLPLSNNNRTTKPFPALSETQLARVINIYADDIEFYNATMQVL